MSCCPPTSSAGCTSSASAARRLSAIARIMASRGAFPSPAATTTTRRSSPGCASSGVTCPPGLRRRPRRRRRHARRHDGRARRQPRGGRGPAPGLAHPAAVRRPVVGDGRTSRGRRGRHPRQDHDDLAAHLRALVAAGADPTYAVGGVLAATGHNAEVGSGDLFVGGGRRERRRLPRLPPARGGGHQRRGRPPRRVGDRGGLPPGLRGVLRRRSTATASWSAASTTLAPARWPTHAARVAGSAWSPWARPPTPTCAPLTWPSSGATSRRSPRCEATRSSARVDLEDPRSPLRRRRAGRAGRRPRARPPVRRAARGTGGVRRHAAGGWRPRARPAAYASTTATPTIRPRSRPTSRPRARWRGRVGWSSPSSPTWSRAPASSGRRWAPRSAPPTRSSSSTSTSRASRRTRP